MFDFIWKLPTQLTLIKLLCGFQIGPWLIWQWNSHLNTYAPEHGNYEEKHHLLIFYKQVIFFPQLFLNSEKHNSEQSFPYVLCVKPFKYTKIKHFSKLSKGFEYEMEIRFDSVIDFQMLQ